MFNTDDSLERFDMFSKKYALCFSIIRVIFVDGVVQSLVCDKLTVQYSDNLLIISIIILFSKCYIMAIKILH